MEDAMLQLVRGAALVAATMAMGLMAGLFYVFAHAIMPGLGRSDDRTFVGAFQAIDRAITNPWFLVSFLGGLMLTVLAAVLHLGGDGRTVLPWTVAALVLYVVAMVITVRVNIPLNNTIQAAGAPDRIADLAAVRDQFEARWVRWNIARGVATTAAFGCLAWALVLYGRTTIPGGA
jgi:uncharacterized membrane protein